MDLEPIPFILTNVIGFFWLPVLDRLCSQICPTIAREVIRSNWQTRSARFNPRSHLSIQLFGIFRGFLRNSCKNGLGSLRKTATQGTPPPGPPISEQLALIQQPTVSKFNYLFNENNFNDGLFSTIRFLLLGNYSFVYSVYFIKITLFTHKEILSFASR